MRVGRKVLERPLNDAFGHLHLACIHDDYSGMRILVQWKKKVLPVLDGELRPLQQVRVVLDLQLVAWPRPCRLPTIDTSFWR